MGASRRGTAPRVLTPPLSTDAEQTGSPRAGLGSDQEDSKPITLGEAPGSCPETSPRRELCPEPCPPSWVLPACWVCVAVCKHVC